MPLTPSEQPDLNIARLISSAAHEVYAPLTTIRGAVTTLIDHRQELDEARVAAFLVSIDAEAETLTEILDCLIDLARIQLGQLRFHPKATSLQPLLIDALESRLGEQAVKVTGPDVWVRVDARRIQQVLTALIGSVAVQLPAGAALDVDLALDAAGDRVIVSIRDYGVVLPVQMVNEQLEHLGHTGPLLPLLRLALSRALVELHSGQLWQSTGQIHFSLPLTRGADAENGGAATIP